MEKEKNEDIIKIITSAGLLALAVMFERLTDIPSWAVIFLYLPSYLVVGLEILSQAAENLIHGKIFGEEFLMSLSTLGAMFIGYLPDSDTMYTEAVLVMLLYSVGEYFEELAEEKSRRSITRLVNIRPDSATVERDGRCASVSPESVGKGETIIVSPGEKIPLDGIVTEGHTTVDTVALTGESLPRDVNPGDEIYSGCVNLSGVVRIEVTKEYGESTATKILDLVENAASKKSRSESFITGFAKYYTPAVVAAAILISFLPPIVMGDFSLTFANWLRRGLTFLVVSCPCALVISVPLTFFTGIGRASAKGILIKGGNYIDTLAKAGIVVFDKTGTLTEGRFEVSEIRSENMPKTELLRLAAYAECRSNHPLAKSICEAYGEVPINDKDVTGIKEIPGEGTLAKVGDKEVAVGNAKLMHRLGTDTCGEDTFGSRVYVAVGGRYEGSITLSDRIKDDAKTAVTELKNVGITKTVMLTGDRKEVARKIAHDVGVDVYRAELMPEDKVKTVEELISGMRKNEKLVFAGDGINDAPVLNRADVGMAMGGMGSDAAIEAADAVIMDDKPSKVAEAIRLSKMTVRRARQNIIFALLIKALVLVLAAFDATPMYVAVFADVGVTLLAVLNAIRK